MADVDAAADTFTRVRRIAAVFADVSIDTISRDTTVIGDLDLDSLDFLQVIHALEEEFRFDLSEDEVLRLSTVGAVADHISARLQQ